jgi:hypothetical protein
MRVCTMLVTAAGGEVARECADDVSRGKTTVGDLFRGLRRYRRRRRVRRRAVDKCRIMRDGCWRKVQSKFVNGSTGRSTK